MYNLDYITSLSVDFGLSSTEFEQFLLSIYEACRIKQDIDEKLALSGNERFQTFYSTYSEQIKVMLDLNGYLL